MSSKHEIKCIKKSDRYSPYESIESIGGYESTWRLSQKKAIEHVNSGKYRFFVNTGGDYLDVIVARCRFGNEYLKTVNDGDHPNNLLSLMECR